jgi:glutamine cyclotransferase
VAAKDVNTGETVASTQLDDDTFGEGITVMDGKMYQVIYQEKTLNVYDAQTLGLLDSRQHPRNDGWGLTNDGQNLILSDGTSTLTFLDPNNPSNAIRDLRVTFEGSDVSQLNELEYKDGYVYANVWKSICIAKIDVSSGNVVGWIDATGLRSMIDEGSSPAAPYGAFDWTLNGLAKTDTDELAVTGKYWNKLFYIRETGSEAIADVDDWKSRCLR